jgi:hypothetical protein
MDILHALLGLAGEAGEIVDQYKKHLFKTGRRCSRAQFLDELGDLFYYIRIVAHLNGLAIADIGIDSDDPLSLTELETITGINATTATLLLKWVTDAKMDIHILLAVYLGLIVRLSQLDCSLDVLTELNRIKLEDCHGWTIDKQIEP